MPSPLRRLALPAVAAALACAGALPACNSCNNAQPDAAAGARADTGGSAQNAPVPAPGNTAPENLMLQLRGATLRRAVPLLFPGGGVAQVLEQLSRQVTPGIADHGDEIDVDAPFAVVVTLSESTEAPFNTFVAWPLRPGMAVAQDARNGRGWRRAGEGLYAPTAPDAGANADDQCWVAQRPSVGWMLLCGKRADLPNVAGFLRERGGAAPDNEAVLDLDVRVPLVRRFLSRQLAQLDMNAPPRADAGVEGMRRALFEQVRRTAALYSSIANDVETLRAHVTQDENAMHLRGEATLSRASSDTTRGLIAASAGRQAQAALAGALPAAVTAYVLGGFDRARAGSIGGEATAAMAAQIAAQAGPELARVITQIDEVKSLTPLGERIDAYSNEDGYTLYHVVRRPDAAQFVNDLRVALNSVPQRAVQAQGAVRLGILPTPGLTGLTYLRIGQILAIPPGAQVPPQMMEQLRAVTERSMLLVAESDRLVAVMARDPIARYRAMGQGARLTVNVPANAVMTGRITAPSFPPMFYGGAIPGLPVSNSTEAVEFSLVAERQGGEGARFEVRADAPIAAATELRQIYAMIQMAQEEQMRQMAEQQQRAAQGGGGAGGMMRPPQPRPQQRPQMDPSMLPEPPRLQLRPPE